MPYYFMRDTPLQALEQLMMSQPGQKPQRRWDIPQPISLHAQRCGVRILPELCPQASVPSM